MALYDYMGALKRGRRQYQESLSKGEHPYLPVLDDILSYTKIVSEVSLGLMDIPLSKIIGTKTEGRTNAFASNFVCCPCMAIQKISPLSVNLKYETRTS